MSILVILLTYVGRALRWQVMVRPLRPESSFSNVLVATMIGFTAIVLFGRAGELVRPYLISQKERVPISSQMAAWLLERILDLLMVLIIFGIAVAQISNSGLTPGPNLTKVLQAAGLVVGLGAAGVLGLLVVFRHFSATMHRRLDAALGFLPDARRRKISGIVEAFLTGMESTRGNRDAVMLLLYSVGEWALIVFCFVSMFQSFPATASLNFTDVVIFMGLVSMGAAVQLPGIGGGMQVASILVFTELFRMPLEVATGLAVAIWVITFVVVVPFGIVLAFREGLNWRSLSHIREEEP